jgi:hypothetical protein
MASRMKGRVHRLAMGLVLLGVMHLACAAQDCEKGDLGCAIFNGQHGLSAHLRDDDRTLPAWTARCVNCHVAAQSAESFAPLLTPDYLQDVQKRRGGPPSAYDETAFCRALKDGADPANIILRKAMPRYTISDNECTALWTYLTKR